MVKISKKVGKMGRFTVFSIYFSIDFTNFTYFYWFYQVYDCKIRILQFYGTKDCIYCGKFTDFTTIKIGKMIEIRKNAGL